MQRRCCSTGIARWHMGAPNYLDTLCRDLPLVYIVVTEWGKGQVASAPGRKNGCLHREKKCMTP